MYSAQHRMKKHMIVGAYKSKHPSWTDSFQLSLPLTVSSFNYPYYYSLLSLSCSLYIRKASTISTSHICLLFISRTITYNKMGIYLASSLLMLKLAVALGSIANVSNEACIDGVDGLLRVNAYQDSCPDVEPIIFSWVQKAVSQDSRMAASLLRLHFHDCFVNASYLIYAWLYIVDSCLGSSSMEFSHSSCFLPWKLALTSLLNLLIQQPNASNSFICHIYYLLLSFSQKVLLAIWNLLFALIYIYCYEWIVTITCYAIFICSFFSFRDVMPRCC